MSRPTFRCLLLLFSVLLTLSQGCATAEYKQRREQALRRVQDAETQRDQAIAEGRATDALLWGAVVQDLRQQVPLTPGEAFGKVMQGAGKGMQDAVQRQSLQQRALEGTQQQDQTVYRADECIGPVIMGQCHGTLVPKPGYHEKCYGSWLGGKCIGPQF